MPFALTRARPGCSSVCGGVTSDYSKPSPPPSSPRRGPASWYRWASIRRRRPKSSGAAEHGAASASSRQGSHDGADQAPRDARALVAQQEGDEAGGHLGRRRVAQSTLGLLVVGAHDLAVVRQRRAWMPVATKPGATALTRQPRLLLGEVLDQAHRGDLGEGVGR